MRDSPQLQFQTPKGDPNHPNRRLKSTPDVKSNPKKVARNILAPELTNVLEESPKEVSDHNSPPDSDENLIASVDPVTKAIKSSPGTFAMLDLASPASTITTAKNVTLDDASQVDSYKIESIEVDMVMKCLKEARIRMLKAEDIGYSRKLLDALVDVMLKEHCGGAGDERKWLDIRLLSKLDLVLLTCMVVILAVFVVWSFNVRAGGTFTGPPPT